MGTVAWCPVLLRIKVVQPTWSVSVHVTLFLSMASHIWPCVAGNFDFLIFYTSEKMQTSLVLLQSSVRIHARVWLDECRWMSFAFSHGKHSISLCLFGFKRFVKCTSGYFQHFIFLLFQVAFNTKQKPSRGWELSLARRVSMVTGLCCSSSGFSLNGLRYLCDPCLLNLDYYVPSVGASYLHTTIASKGAAFLHCDWSIWTQTPLFSVFLTSHDKVHTKITEPLFRLHFEESNILLASLTSVIPSQFSPLFS